jgi:hypothetical protein
MRELPPREGGTALAFFVELLHVPPVIKIFVYCFHRFDLDNNISLSKHKINDFELKSKDFTEILKIHTYITQAVVYADIVEKQKKIQSRS